MRIRALSTLHLSLFSLVLLLAGAPFVQGQDVTTSETPAPEDLREFPFAPGRQSVQIRGEQGFTTTGDLATGIGRTTVTYGDMSLTADHVTVNLVTQVVEAEGNVVFKSPGDQIRASELRYDFRRHIGQAFDVEGVSNTIHFRTEWDESERGASFRRVSEEEAIFRGASYTTSGFPVPTWRMTADEIILYPDDRIFLRNATIWLRGVPVMWLPFYTRSIRQSSPWSFEAGYLSDYGPYLRAGYQFTHETLVPDWEDPTKYRLRSGGSMALHGDVFTQGAVGTGVDYDYQFEFEKHLGNLAIYGVRDSERDVEGEDITYRYYYRQRHNSVFGNTIWQLDIDWMRDPDIYRDFSDVFSEDERGRRPERRARFAVTYLEDDWLARLQAERKDRISIPEYQDYSEPQADNLNYDPDPDFTQENNIDTDGISHDRYGRVSEKFEGTFATRLLPLPASSLLYNVEANAFNNLDPGFNEVSDDDDRRIYGGDLRGALTHRARLDDEGRITWMNTVGMGMGYYERTSDRLIPRETSLGPTRPAMLGSLTLLDKETIIAGADNRVSYGDVSPFMLWGDYISQLSARFTENMSGYLKYTGRLATTDSAGEFFEETGRLEAFEDIYNFPRDQHWLEALLSYYPLFPQLEVYSAAGYNLEGGDAIDANERLWYAGGGVDYVNDSGEFFADTSLFWEGRQARDRSSPNEYEYSEVAGNIGLEYIPHHGRYWAALDIDGVYPLEDDPVGQPARRRARFDENEADVSIRPLIGKEFGPKYDVEVFVEYNTRLDDLKEGGVLVTRDLYDADLMLFAGFRSTTFEDRDDQDDTNSDRLETDTELDFRVGLKFKAPQEQAGLSAISIKTLRDRRQEPVFVD